MKTLPRIILLFAGCVGLAACGEGDAPPADDGYATLSQALGLGDLPGAGEHLGAPPSAGDHLGAPPSAGDGLGAIPDGRFASSPPGDGDGLGRAPGAGDVSGGEVSAGDLCRTIIERLVECGFLEEEDEKDAVKDCKDAIKEAPPATVAAIQRCPSSCRGLLECLTANAP